MDLSIFSKFREKLSDVSKYLKFYNNNLDITNSSLKTNAIVTKSSNTEFNNYLKGLNGAKASMGGYVKSLISAKGGMGAYIKSLVSAKISTVALSAASMALNAVISMFVGLAISAAVTAISNLINKQKEARQAALDSAQAASTQISSLRDLKNEYISIVDGVESEEEKNKQLLSWKQQLIDQYGLERDAIEQVNLSRESGIKLIDKEISKSANNWLVNNKKVYDEAVKAIEKGTTQSGIERTLGLGSNTDSKKYESKLNAESTKDYEELSRILKNLNLDYLSLEKSASGYSNIKLDSSDLIDQKAKIEEVISKLQNKQSTAQSTTKAEEALLDELKLYYIGLSSEVENYQETYIQGNKMMAQSLADDFMEKNPLPADKDSFDIWKSGLENMAGASEGVRAALGTLADENFPQFVNSSEQSVQTVKETVASFDDLSKQVDEFQDAYRTLSTALEEYNENGSLSIDTLQALLALQPQYLAALQLEDGQIALNEASISSLIEAMKIDAITKLQSAASADILALANGNVESMSDTAKSAVSNLGVNIETAGNQAATATSKMSGFAVSVMEAVLASGASLPNTADFEKQKNAILKSYESIGNGIANIGINFKSEGASKKKSGSKESKDAWKEAYEKEKAQLDLERETEQITEQQYFDQLTALTDKYFKGREKYLTEYNKNIVELFKLQRELSKDRIKDVEHEIFLLQQREGTEEQQVKLYRDIQDEINSQLKDAYDYGLDNHSDYVQELQKQWYDYNQKVLDVYQSTQDQLKKQMDDLTSKQSAIVEGYVDILDKQIEDLEKRKDSVSDYWDAQIDAYKKEHDALKEKEELEEKLLNIEKEKQKLENLKKQKILMYKKGQGFVLDVDQAAIDDQQQVVNDAQKDYDDTIKEIEYKKHIEMLEAQKKAALDAIDAEIDKIKDLRDQWNDVIDNIKKEIESNEEQMELWTEFQAATFEQQMAILKIFTADYKSQMSEIQASIQETINAIAALKAAQASGFGGSAPGSTTWKGNAVSAAQQQQWENDGWRYVSGANGGTWEQNGHLAYKDGTLSVGRSLPRPNPFNTLNALRNNQVLAKTQEEGPELRILNKGDGIIPANITRNLWSWGMMKPTDLFGELHNKSYINPNMIRNTQQSIVINGNLEFPSVHNGDDAKSFISELFKKSASQMRLVTSREIYK